MREIGSFYQVIDYWFTAAILALILALDYFDFSSNEIIAIASLLTITGFAIMLKRFLSVNSN
jgi:hypothetical protein